MKFLSLVGNSFGCSASGERLVSAARDGDVQEAKALLEYNPRLARYSTFGVRNSPLHYSAAHGHHEIVYLLLESGVDINLRNYRGQTALMQACQHGHWEVVQTLIIFKANIHKTDYLNGGTALHLAALNGHTRCIRLILADYIPSIPNFWDILQTGDQTSISEFDQSGVCEVINKTSDGGITALHMAALNGHVESVQLLLDLGASVSEVTVEDGTTIDLIGSGSTPLHYAACGGNAQCCQLLIAKGASLTAENANGWTPLMVARSWHRSWLEDTLKEPPAENLQVLPSPYISLPLMSIVKIARECGWRTSELTPICLDPCAVCLERKCMVAVEGCDHEFCTQCALYLCSTNSTSTRTHGPPGSIACPLCRHSIVSFVKLPDTRPLPKVMQRTTTNLSLTFCTCSSEVLGDSTDMTTPFCTNITAVTAGDTPYTSATTFEELSLSPELLKGLYVEMKFEKPSKIQAKSLPMILNPPHRDLIAQAHNGSGKTTCFNLGMLSRVDPNLQAPQALCICPTRELAIQNIEVLRKMGKYTGISSECAVPMDRRDSIPPSKRAPIMAQVVIGTPGTIKNLITYKKLGVTKLKILVFDEADQMLAEDGFRDDSLRIMKEIERFNSSCQVLLFSATFNDTVKNFATRVVGKKEHNELFVKKEELSLDAVKQYKVLVPDELAKIDVIKDYIFEIGENVGQTIIFVRTRNSAKMLHKALVDLGYEVTSIQGALDHDDRDKIVKEFKDGLTQVLISTDVLARGFDQQQVNLVINYDLPLKYSAEYTRGQEQEPDYEVYLHRVGRAGRFGRKGAVFNLICGERDEKTLSKIEKHFGTYIKEVKDRSVEDYKVALKEAGLLF